MIVSCYFFVSSSRHLLQRVFFLQRSARNLDGAANSARNQSKLQPPVSKCGPACGATCRRGSWTTGKGAKSAGAPFLRRCGPQLPRRLRRDEASSSRPLLRRHDDGDATLEVTSLGKEVDAADGDGC